MPVPERVPTLPADPEPSFARVLGATLTGNLYLVVGTIFFSILTLLAALLPPRGL